MLVIKKKYNNRTMSNGKVGKFNTNDIVDKMKKYYFDNGFSHIFDTVCDKCEKKTCICK